MKPFGESIILTPQLMMENLDLNVDLPNVDSVNDKKI